MMRKLNVPTQVFAVSLALVASAAGAPSALASPGQVVSDCNSNGYLTGHYSRADLQSALSGMGADVKEYTNCYDVIRRALAATAAGGAGHGGGGSSSGGAAGGGRTGGGNGGASAGGSSGVSTRGVYGRPANALAAGAGSRKAVLLSGESVAPGSSGVGSSSAVHSLPAPLIVVLILLGLAALSGGGVAVRRRVVARGGG
jgi:hypothetical protein